MVYIAVNFVQKCDGVCMLLDKRNVRQANIFLLHIGPFRDHTFGNVNGYYVFADASSGSPGDRAWINSPTLRPIANCEVYEN